MKPKTQPPALYIGMVESAAGETLVIVADDLEKGQRELFKLWRSTVYKGFRREIKNFADLNEWSGASLCKVEPNKAYRWGMLESEPILTPGKRSR